MRISGEKLFSRVAPYIQTSQEVKDLVQELDGMEKDEAIKAVEARLASSSGALATDIKILMNALEGLT